MVALLIISTTILGCITGYSCSRYFSERRHTKTLERIIKDNKVNICEHCIKRLDDCNLGQMNCDGYISNVEEKNER